MKKRTRELKDEFNKGFQQHIAQLNMKYVGAEPIETNDAGDPMFKNKVPKGYNKEYIKILKQYEQHLLSHYTLQVQMQNKQYYYDKCANLIADCNTNQIHRAAANIMLESDSPHLKDLYAKYKGKLVSPDVNVNCGDRNACRVVTTQDQLIKMCENVKNRTPDNIKKVKGSEANIFSNNNDKENRKENDPKKPKITNKTTSFNIRDSTREPFKQLKQQKDNIKNSPMETIKGGEY